MIKRHSCTHEGHHTARPLKVFAKNATHKEKTTNNQSAKQSSNVKVKSPAVKAKRRLSVQIPRKTTTEIEDLFKGVFPLNTMLKSPDIEDSPHEHHCVDTNNKRSKCVRIDEAVEVVQFTNDDPQQHQRRPLVRNRSKSLDTSERLDKFTHIRKIESFYPRRRFSQSAVSSINDIFDKVKREHGSKVFSPTKEMTKDDFALLSRDEKLSFLHSKELLPDNCVGWITQRSLTGNNFSGWKFQDNYYGHIYLSKRPSMDTAWGRRIFDQHEIETDLNEDLILNKSCKGKYMGKVHTELGLWDFIYNPSTVPKMESYLKWSPLNLEKKKEIKKLKIDPAILEECVVIRDEGNDAVSKFKLKFSKPGEYLKASDLKFCLEHTSFSEDQIIKWFKRFRKDCPDGRLHLDTLRELFRKVFPHGNAEQFSRHIIRIFDIDGNGFLDFKEFLQAMDVTKSETEASKIMWAFKLFDQDNDGVIEINEMIQIMESLESLDHFGRKIRQMLNTNDDLTIFKVQTAEERARDLFAALDSENRGYITPDVFIQGYLERNELLARQDAEEQKRFLDCLILKGPGLPTELVNRSSISDVVSKEEKLAIADLIRDKTQVRCGLNDVKQVSFRDSPGNKAFSLSVRFSSSQLRNLIWNQRFESRKNGLILEEYLTPTRIKVLKRCKGLKVEGLIRDVETRNGDVFVTVPSDQVRHLVNLEPRSQQCELLVVTDTHYENLVRLIKGLVLDKESRRQIENQINRSEREVS